MQTDPTEYILGRQAAWATRNGKVLQGSKQERGRRVYTKTLDDNLFEPLTDVGLGDYTGGDGHELGGVDGNPGKMQALHSSSALCVNVFHYWRARRGASAIARACGLPTAGLHTIRFEQQLPIDATQFRYAPNLDALLRYKSGDLIGVESKFSEPFSSRRHAGMKAAYLEPKCNEFWSGWPALRQLAGEICPTDTTFAYLDAAQLLKHLLGLRRNAKGEFRLLYLYYGVPGSAGAAHGAEVERFISLAKQDGLAVSALTYQDVILRLLRTGGSEHAAYLNYVSERYL